MEEKNIQNIDFKKQFNSTQSCDQQDDDVQIHYVLNNDQQKQPELYSETNDNNTNNNDQDDKQFGTQQFQKQTSLQQLQKLQTYQSGQNIINKIDPTLMSSENNKQSRNSFKIKNMEMLEKKRQQLLKAKEEKELEEKKKMIKQEKLKKKILEEAAKLREEKEKDPNYQLQQEQKKDLLIQQQKLKSKRKENDIITLYKDGKVKLEDLDGEQQKIIQEYEIKYDAEKKEKQKMKKLFRSRYATYLSSIKEDKNKKKEFEEKLKLREELKKQQIKPAFENVTSKLHSETASSKNKDVTNNGTILPPINQKLRNRSASSEAVDNEFRQQQLKEAQKKLLEKQKEYLQKIKGKKQTIKEQEEEEKQKKEHLKHKMRDYVLIQVKKDIENGDFYIEDPKEIKKQKKNKQSEQHQSKDMSEYKSSHSARKSADQKDLYDNMENEKIDEDEDEKPKKKKKLRSYPFITDFDQWKKKQRLPQDQKIFIVNGGYPQLKKALRDKGWLENPDSHSQCFDLKWSLQGKDLDYDNLKDYQVVNHFQKNSCLTTKIGLCKNLKNLIWFSNVDIDYFFPRCFDLNDPEDYQNFLEDFKTTKAESILKTYMRMYKTKDQGLEDFKKVTKIALQVCQRKVRDLNDLIDDKSKDPFCLISDKEWEILSQDELNSESLAVRKHQSWLDKIQGNTKPKRKKKKKKKVKKQLQEQEQKNNENSEEEDEEEENEPKMDEFTQQVFDILQYLEQNYPQYSMNGENNIWILKPAGLSRGRGITCYNNLIEIEDHVKSKEMQWVIQKYMENPLIIQNRKFDIRVWVMVTDFNPLTIWQYDEVYLRFSAVDYNQEAKELSNKLLHLCNNCVTSKNQGSDNIVGYGNMYSQEQFSEFLQQQEGSDVFKEKILPGIKQAVKHSIECIQDQIEQRKNSCEIFGYDFMVDDLYNVWLLEVNSSPSMEYSTDVTERLVKECLSDTAKVLLDYIPAKKKKGIDTGKWKKLFKGSSYQDKNINNLGLNLCLEGVAIKKKGKQNMAKVNNIQLNNNSKK